jgi:hypothetical protein
MALTAAVARFRTRVGKPRGAEPGVLGPSPSSGVAGWGGREFCPHVGRHTCVGTRAGGSTGQGGRDAPANGSQRGVPDAGHQMTPRSC